MNYRKCGNSGLYLPEVSLGLWHNFGSVDVYENSKAMILKAFERGVTHFDLANNYGPVPGSAESNFGRILSEELPGRRDEMVITTKAGYTMWGFPYGDGGSRKYLMASLHQSLKRMRLDYVDIFYSHRFNPETPQEETLQTLVDIVRQGKALYVGISNYNGEQTQYAVDFLADQKVHCLVHQAKYSLFMRAPESDLFPVLKREGVGMVAFSPLAQGLLTDKYLTTIPENSRAAKPTGFLQRSQITPEVIEKVKRLNQVAQQRGVTLAQLALKWTLRDEVVASTIIGASSVEQLEDNLAIVDQPSLSAEELAQIELIINH